MWGGWRGWRGLWVTAVETACELQNKKTADSNLIMVQKKKKKNGATSRVILKILISEEVEINS